MLAALLAGCAPAVDEWLNGINLPWIDFGKDFGPGTSVPKMAEAFADFEKAGMNSVRVWVHCDGRHSPSFDKPGGQVTGLPEGFLDDFEAMLDAAQQHDIHVMPALWSFDMVKDRTKAAGPFAGVQQNLILKDEYLDSYIEHALLPMLGKLDDHPALYAWEICNEPEWMVEHHDIPLDALQRFHGRIAAAIHKHGKKPVTTGSASIKWSSEKFKANWWSDEALQAAYKNRRAFLDFYQVHFYDWMLEHGYDPYAYTPEELGLDKPVMIGEAPGKPCKKYSLTDMLERAREKGYSGHYFWSYSANDGHGGWEQIKAALSQGRSSGSTKSTRR